MLPAVFQESQESPLLGGDTAAPLARVLRETDVMSSPTLQGLSSQAYQGGGGHYGDVQPGNLDSGLVLIFSYLSLHFSVQEFSQFFLTQCLCV